MVAHWKKILLPCCLSVSISNGYTNPPDPRVFDDGDVYRLAAPGRRRTIPWPSADPVPIHKEVQLLMSGTLLRRGEFGPLHGSRAIEVDLECAELGIDLDQALSIRKQLMMGKVLKGGASKLKDQCTIKRIRKEFEQRQRSLLDISQAYDLPPVSILRAILAPRVLNAYPQFTCLDRSRPAGRIVQSIISGDDPDRSREFLSEWEVNELKVAKEFDMVGYSSGNCTAAEEWERTIYDFLDGHGIKYITEDTLNFYGYGGRGTPDCLLVDDLYIHGKRVGWIEFKCFYASGLRQNTYFTRKSVGRQVEKYQKAFGTSGAVILKHGFSTEISQRYPSTLLLDGGSLNSKNEFNL